MGWIWNDFPFRGKRLIFSGNAFGVFENLLGYIDTAKALPGSKQCRARGQAAGTDVAGTKPAGFGPPALKLRQLTYMGLGMLQDEREPLTSRCWSTPSL